MLNVIEFAEAVGVHPSPVQKTLLKVIFGVPLNSRSRDIHVYDDLREKCLYRMTETEYLDMCYNEERCNYKSAEIDPEGFREAHLFQGRRSGKSIFIDIASAYKTYRLLLIDNPQRHFGLIQSSPIDLSMIGLDENASERYMSRVHNLVDSTLFSAYSPQRGNDRTSFYTTADSKKLLPPSVAVRAYSSSSRACRGATNYGLFFDDFAFFKNSYEVYDAVAPCTLNFSDPLILSVTTPWHTTGKAFDIHQSAFSLNKSYVFTHNENTATLNPSIPSEVLIRAKARHPDYFKSEFGAKFIGKGNVAVSLKDLSYSK